MTRRSKESHVMKPLALAALLTAAASIASPATAKTVEAQACAIDGDTIRLGGEFKNGRCQGGEKIRIWGINTQERGEPRYKSGASKLAALIKGKLVVCTFDGTHTFDRSVARCAVEGQDIGRAMVASGEARDCKKFSKGAYATVDQRAWATPDHRRMCE